MKVPEKRNKESTLKTEYREKTALIPGMGLTDRKDIEKRKGCKSIPEAKEKREREPRRSRNKRKAGRCNAMHRKKRLSRKSAGRMPWHWEPKKDVTSCEKPRGGAHIP